MTDAESARNFLGFDIPRWQSFYHLAEAEREGECPFVLPLIVLVLYAILCEALPAILVGVGCGWFGEDTDWAFSGHPRG